MDFSGGYVGFGEFNDPWDLLTLPFFPKKEKRFGRSDVMFASPAVSVPAFHPSRA